jgi:hypothetical protein
MGQGDKALRDAQICRSLRCDWPKACFLEGAAHMLLKVLFLCVLLPSLTVFSAGKSFLDVVLQTSGL